MRKILIAPLKYVQGEDELNNLGTHVAPYGSKVLLVASDEDRQRVSHKLEAAQQAAPFEIVHAVFGGEITRAEIARLQELMTASGCDVVAGLGGGKALDTAKAVAHHTGKSCIIIPTIASTDAPCSSLAVIYTEDGVFETGMIFDRSPAVVLVDTVVIAHAPARFLISGMGDALATYFEARASASAFSNNIPGAASTRAALAIARECFDILMEDSLKAKAAVESHVVTPALENVIEANILLSGIGFESGGLGAAHSIHNGLTVLPQTHAFFHGEKVSFGVLVQLVLENADQAEVDRIIAYCKAVGLPTCLKDLGVERTHENAMKVAIASVAETETIHNMPFTVTAADVYGAILVADALGS